MTTERYKTKFMGVFYRYKGSKNKHKKEKVFYIRYRKEDNKIIEQKVGNDSDGMTASKAYKIRCQLLADNSDKSYVRNEYVKEKFDIVQEDLQQATLKEIWDIYVETYPEKKSILRTDRFTFNHLKKLWNRFPYSITTLEVDKLRIEISKKTIKGKKKNENRKVSVKYVRDVLELLRRLINFGVKRNLCDRPTRLYIDMPKVDNEKQESMTDEQLKRYLKALDEEKDQNLASMLRLALITGMRKGALLSLEWTDIDFDNAFIILRGETAKKGKTERIPLSQTARNILENLKRTESNLVFPNSKGKKRIDIYKTTTRLKQKAGLPDDFRPLHGLRHTFASRLASSGKVDLYTLQRLLTHESPAMTQRYAHLCDERLKQAALIADEILK